MNTKTEISANIMAQARDWYVRLADEQAGASDWEAFTLWLEESTVHVDAYDHVEIMLSDISATNTPKNVKNNVVPLLPKRRATKSYMKFAGLAAVLIAALTLLTTTNILHTKSMQTQFYATNIGEREDIVLTDGTHISLNTNSQISVSMRKKSRTVTLKKGEAYFKIASDKTRPFKVLAQDTTITDIGTAFSVYSSDQALTVSVAQGIVDMTNGEHVVRLTLGQKAVQKRDENDITVIPIEVENISTWRGGVLVFEDASLSKIVPELNRYFQKPIALSGDEVADITFSGVLNIRDQQTLLESMEALMPINVEAKNSQILISSEN